jgi:hypothetical protein
MLAVVDDTGLDDLRLFFSEVKWSTGKGKTRIGKLGFAALARVLGGSAIEMGRRYQLAGCGAQAAALAILANACIIS